MYKIKELSNGMKVLMENLPNLNSVSLGVYVKTGSKNETEGEFGVSHLLEHMMFKGTEKRSAKEISEVIDNIGGQINAYTSKEITAYYTVLLAEHINTGIDILSDIIINSTFTEENIIKEKKVVIEEIRMYDDVPEDLVHDMNSQYVVDGPQGRPILGTIESVNNISRETLFDYYQNRYTPENMVISVAGKIDEEKLIMELEEKFSGLSRKFEERKEDLNFTIKAKNNIINRKTNQVHLCFNTQGTSYLENERYTLSIISNILGGNMSSRLFQKIREDKGLCYSVYTYLSSYEENGMFTVYVGTTKENYTEVMDIIRDEFKDIKENGVDEAELDKAKNQLLSSMILSLESSKSRMSRMASNYLSLGKIVEVEEIIEKVNKVDLGDVKSLAQRIFDESLYSYTIIGDIEDEGSKS